MNKEVEYVDKGGAVLMQWYSELAAWVYVNLEMLSVIGGITVGVLAILVGAYRLVRTVCNSTAV